MKHLGTRLRVISLLVILSVFFGLLTTDKASAIFPNDRSAKYGYFTGDYFDWNTTAQKNVLPPASDDMARYVCGTGNTTDEQAIPSCIDNVAELVRFLKKRNDIESTSSYYRQMTTGSAFIVYTMLGYGSADYDRVIPQNSSLWDELTDRLNASTIKWSGNVSSSINTIWRYTSSRNDVVWYDDYVSGPGILITSPSSGESYRLLRGCANPIGELAPLEEAKVKTWAIKPSITIYVDKDADGTYEESTSSGTISVPIGAKLYWKSSIENTGEGETTQGIEYGYTKSGNDAWSGSASYSTNVMLGIGKEVSSTSGRLKVVADDAGHTFCELTYARPKSSSSGGTINSAAACIKVKDINWVIKPSTMVSVSDGRSETAVTSKKTINSVSIGSTVSWKGILTNTGDDKTTEDIKFGYTKSDGWSGSGFYDSVGLASREEVYSNIETRTITQNDAGKTFCKLTSADPHSSSDSNIINSAAACIKVKDITWSITPSTTVKVNDGYNTTSKTATTFEKTIDQVPIGSIVSWTSTIKNNGPDNATSDIEYRYHNDSVLEDRAGTEYGNIKNVGMLGVGISDSIDSYLIGGTTFEIKPNDAGKKFCRRTKVWPTSSTNSDYTESEYACIKVEDTYDITPTVTVSSNTIVPGDSFVVNMSVHVKRTNSISANDIDWKLTRVSASSKNNSYLDTGGDSDKEPSYYYGGWEVSGTVKSGRTTFSSENYLLPSYTETDSFAVSTEVCYALSVSPFDHPQTNIWRHSSLVCVVVGKKPKVQIWGGDVRAGGNVTTSLPRKNSSGAIFGSWSEYGILAKGSITGMASAGPFTSTETCKYSVLTFANTEGGSYSASCNNTSVKGNYHLPDNLPDVATIFPTSGSSPVAVGAILSGDSGTFQDPASKTLTLDGGTIYKNTWFVINAPDTEITITGDIVYDDTSAITDSKQIPQLVIIAKNIKIEENVKRIDAWLIAKSGEIDTCFNVSESELRTGNCRQQLTINGPVIAKKILLKRTYGSDNASDNNPAEIFNLRADAYLWLAAHHSSNDRLQTVYTTELPPRF